ncbi:unnamed protein product [Dibothriocephalus latus]|uniref:Heparan sulphate-N-deacetylase domain-containing protein n=1 Tax=Dibothriocephalus latus TaxID=60516 RepID=A0A3P7M480_DIBLA|nr:unnamed protein product [Dibothriocephalus latus]
MELPIYAPGLPARKIRIILVAFGLLTLGFFLLSALESQFSTLSWSQPLAISVDVRPHKLQTHRVPYRRLVSTKPDITISPNSKVLLLKSSSTSKDSSTISAALQAQRVPFVGLAPDRFYLLPSFLSSAPSMGQVNLIIFEQFLLWTKLLPEYKTAVDNYCRKFGAGVIGFLLDEDLIIRRPKSFMQVSIFV